MKVMKNETIRTPRSVATCPYTHPHNQRSGTDGHHVVGVPVLVSAPDCRERRQRNDDGLDSGVPPEVPPAATLQIDLTRGDYKLQQRVPFVGEAQSVTIENIAAGPWDVTVRLLDESGIPTYEGAGSAHVQAGKSVNTHVVLMPVPDSWQ